MAHNKKEISEYKSLLKHPLWQRKRLEIMQRDGFTCQICGKGINDGTPLNVHHKKYIFGMKPWEYTNDNLITLCENCHKTQHRGFLGNSNKNVFFRALLSENLSANEKIIISYILSNNLLVEKKAKIQKETKVSRSTIMRFFNKFEDFNDFKKYVKQGFFPLVYHKNLSCEILIFYSWLCDLAGSAKIIYCNREKLCQLYHSDMNDMKYYLKRLNQLGFVKRNEKNNLIIV